MSHTLQKSLLEFSRVSRENSEETDGFDIQAGLTWIYPTNYPIREYQYTIIEQALYKNTLVNLPTGLGKTFIAAVIMFNYYRWYPTGKIIFMAPTRPLVKQQVDACYNITAIPKEVTAELTGTNKNSMRNDVWLDKRVFFVTPQVLQNDLDSCPELASLIKCIVVDEAHKARGNYAYCEVMRKMRAHAKYFRVLALSATPGNSINDVGEVIKSLMISHLEYRTEESEDVKPYVFERKLDTIVVPLGSKLEQVKNDYAEVLERYNRTLLKHRVFQGNCSNLTKGAIFRIKKEFQEKQNRAPNYKEISLTLNICISLYHANELLIRHGLRGFLGYFEEHINDPLLRHNTDLMRIMEDVRSYLGPLPNVDMLPDGSYPEVPSNITFGHPKFYRLRDILIHHFNNSEDDSKVIVFFEYRDSVKEAFLILLQARPIIRPEMFVGQKSGSVTQKMQLKVIKTFRDGNCNTLLSTSIGEEGLDVGEVDLIICFDISNKSPIRMVQRMGRTGRKREGKVVILVTEGREQQTLNDCLFHKNNMKSWAGSKELMKKFFVESPRMVPNNIQPHCMKMQITVTKPAGTKNSSIKNFTKKFSSESTSCGSEDTDVAEIDKRIPEQLTLFNRTYSEVKNFDFKPSYCNYIEHQRIFQCDGGIDSSDATKLFVDLMKFADAKRFNIPLTQTTQMSSKNFKQRDIRNMFMSIGTQNNIVSSQDDFIIPTLPFSTQKEVGKEDASDREFQKKLQEEIAIYLSIQETTTERCEFCDKAFKCTKYNSEKNRKFLEELDNWVPPDLNFFESVNAEQFESYLGLQEFSNAEAGFSEFIDDDFSDLFPDEKIKEKSVGEKSFSFNMPDNFENLLDKYNITSTLPKSSQTENIGKVEVVAEVSSSMASNNESAQNQNEGLESVLSFFKLDKIEDIFEADENSNESINSNKTITDEQLLKDLASQRESSPILSTQVSQRRRVIPKKKNERKPGSPVLDSSILCRSQIEFRGSPSLDIIDTSVDEKETFALPKIFSQKQFNNLAEKRNIKNRDEEFRKASFGSTTSEEENLLGIFSTRKKPKISITRRLNLIDIFEVEAFGLTAEDIIHSHNAEETQRKENIHPTRFDNDSYNFSRLVNAESTRMEEKNPKRDENKIISEESRLNVQTKNSHQVSVPKVDEFCDLSIFGLTQDEEAVNSKLNETKQVDNNISLEIDDNSFHVKHSSTQNNQRVNLETYQKINENVDCSASVPNGSRSQKKTEYDKKDMNDDVVIIEDSPVKTDFIDITQSPEGIKKPLPKRKILSQMSITQILSLADKPIETVSALTGWSSSAEEKTEKLSPKLDNFSNKRCTFETSTTLHKNVDGKCGVTNSNTKKCDSFSFDGLSDFEIEESLVSKETSPVFKKPVTSLKNSSENVRKRKIDAKSEIHLKNYPVLKNSNRTQINSSILNSNSDDEFEDSMLLNTSITKKNNLQKKQNNLSHMIPKKKVRKKKKSLGFIEDEAEVSFDADSISSDESVDDGSFDESFVDDDIENTADNTQVQAKYLQSVRSPTTGPKFKMPKFLKPITDDIFSQPAARYESSSYVADSFCVDTEDVLEESNELSELEILENKLKEMRKKRKRENKEKTVAKRRRIRMIESDSE